MIKGVIFDMDGLMVDSEVVVMRSFKDAIVEHGFEYPEGFHQEITGRNNDVAIEIMGEKYFGYEAANSILNRVLVLIDEDFSKNGVPIKKGLFEIFDYLEKNNIKIAVASSNTRVMIEGNLEDLELIKKVDYISAGDEVELSKPHPEIFIKAAEGLGVPRENSVILEDSIFGVEGAVNAGIDVIIIPDTIPHTKESIDKAVAVFDDLLKVIDYIEDRNQNSDL